MADLKISQLTSGNPAQTGDEIPIARSGANFKLTAGSIAALPPTTATANQVVYVNSAGTSLVGSANFTFDGTNTTVGGTSTATRFNPTGSSITGTGVYLPAANTLGFSTNGTDQLRIANTASAVNYVQVTGSATSPGAASLSNIIFTGSDSSVSGVIVTKGTSGYIAFSGNSSTNTQAFRVTMANASNTGNLINVQGALAGSAPSIQALAGPSGSDTNINLSLQAKGTGQVQELVGSTNYALASQYDVGTAPNQIPLNQYLGTMAFQDALAVSVGQLRANTVNGIGYSLGAGGAVTQATSRTTGVTLNTICGAITLVSAAGTTAWQSFTVTNSAVAVTDTVIVNQRSGTDLNMIHVTNIAAGSFRITFATTAGTTVEQPVFNFAVIKAVAA